MSGVTAEEAVRRAFWMVKVPSMAVLLVPLLGMLLLIELGVLPDEGPIAMAWSIPTIVGSIAGSWLVWSIQVPRWRLWAYRNAEDIAAVKRLAAEKQIIWPEGSIFEKTEIASREVTKTLSDLEGRAERDEE
jgi:hypothetical protein